MSVNASSRSPWSRQLWGSEALPAIVPARITTAAMWPRSRRAEIRNKRAMASGPNRLASISAATALQPQARAATAIATVSIKVRFPIAETCLPRLFLLANLLANRRRSVRSNSLILW
jgi:hypothetical protein